MLTSMSSFPSALNRLNRPHNLTLILRDVGKNPLKNIPYEIRDLDDRVVKSGATDGQGQIKLVYQAGVRLNLYLQPLKQGKMQKYKEFTTQSQDGSVVWTTSLLLAEAELKPEGDAGEYWRGTYEVKTGDTLTSIAKHYGTQVSTLLALNPSIKDKDEIAVGIVLRVPPNKQSNDRNSERRNPPKSKSADEPAKSSASTPSAVQTRPPESEVLPNQSAMPAQSNRTTSTQISVVPSAPTGSSSTGIQNQQVQQQRTPKVDVQPIRKVESSNREGNSVTTLTPECVCKQSQLIWGSKVNCAFRKKVVEISKRINCDPNDLMAVMAVETGRSFLPYQLSNKKGHPQPKSASEVTESMVASRAVGLIQFTRSAVDELNAQLSKSGKASISKLKLARMSAVEQLDYVELHIKTAADRHMKGKRLTLSDLYTSVFAPAHMGKGEDAVLYHSGTKAYSANQSVDIGDGRGGKPDGKITKAELAKRTSDLKQEGANHYSNYLDHEAERVPTTITQAQAVKSDGASKKSECKDGCSVAIHRNVSKTPTSLCYPLVIRATHDYHQTPRKFGSNRDKFKNGRTVHRLHAGVDLYAPAGTIVRAVADGEVAESRYFDLGVDQISIIHGHLVVRYCEIRNRLVKPGDRVERGQPIAEVGVLQKIKVPSNMLHLEVYESSTDPRIESLTNVSNSPYQRRRDLVDPTPYVDKMQFEPYDPNQWKK